MSLNIAPAGSLSVASRAEARVFNRSRTSVLSVPDSAASNAVERSTSCSNQPCAWYDIWNLCLAIPKELNKKALGSPSAAVMASSRPSNRAAS